MNQKGGSLERTRTICIVMEDACRLRSRFFKALKHLEQIDTTNLKVFDSTSENVDLHCDFVESNEALLRKPLPTNPQPISNVTSCDIKSPLRLYENGVI